MQTLVLAEMKMGSSVRWAFNSRQWYPSWQEWMRALSFIQQEEKERIGKFVFKKDAKASLAGRLLLRKFACEELLLDWKKVLFERTEKGRPFLSNTLPQHVDLNVSHQGDWVVFASTDRGQIGVDVMKVEYIGGKSIPEFFCTMRRQFTVSEWEFIKSFPTEGEQLKAFYRHWCLKEGVVKALGVGIGFELQRVSFQPNTRVIGTDQVVCDTQVYIDGHLDPDWYFEEVMMDIDHVVAVAIKHQDPEGVKELRDTAQKVAIGCSFQVHSFNELVKSGVQLTPPDKQTALEFIRKEESPWS